MYDRNGKMRLALMERYSNALSNLNFDKMSIWDTKVFRNVDATASSFLDVDCFDVNATAQFLPEVIKLEKLVKKYKEDKRDRENFILFGNIALELSRKYGSMIEGPEELRDIGSDLLVDLDQVAKGGEYPGDLDERVKNFEDKSWRYLK
tara:strand:- start:49 stop:495 length:447 start_codon:yes stop_codon:yes gene_type:complete